MRVLGNRAGGREANARQLSPSLGRQSQVLSGLSLGLSSQARLTDEHVARPGVVETPLSALHPLHPVPRPGRLPSYIPDLAAAILANGFGLGQAIPVARLPDGRLVQLGGHHRAAALVLLGETMIPARLMDWTTLPVRVQNWWRTRYPNFAW